MKRLFFVSYTYYVSPSSYTIRNVVSVLTAFSEDEALGIAYRTAREKYSKEILINVIGVSDEHVIYAYNQLKGDQQHVDLEANTIGEPQSS